MPVGSECRPLLLPGSQAGFYLELIFLRYDDDDEITLGMVQHQRASLLPRLPLVAARQLRQPPGWLTQVEAHPGNPQRVRWELLPCGTWEFPCEVCEREFYRRCPNFNQMIDSLHQLGEIQSHFLEKLERLFALDKQAAQDFLKRHQDVLEQVFMSLKRDES